MSYQKVAAVFHDEYWGTVGMLTTKARSTTTSRAVFKRLTGLDRINRYTQVTNNYVEHWEAYGSKHKGMITRIWIGKNAATKAQKLHKSLLDRGVKQSEDYPPEEKS